MALPKMNKQMVKSPKVSHLSPLPSCWRLSRVQQNEHEEEFAKVAVSTELKDPASMTPTVAHRDCRRCLVSCWGQMARVPHGPSIFPAQDPEHSARRRIREVLHAPLCSWASFGKMPRRVVFIFGFLGLPSNNPRIQQFAMVIMV
jgi:hypothetical protein